MVCGGGETPDTAESHTALESLDSRSQDYAGTSTQQREGCLNPGGVGKRGTESYIIASRQDIVLSTFTQDLFTFIYRNVITLELEGII